MVRRPGTVQDEKKKGGTGEGGQTKAPGNIYYKTLVTYLDIDRSGCNGECFERNPLVRSISLISFFPSPSPPVLFLFQTRVLFSLPRCRSLLSVFKIFSFISRNESRGFFSFFVKYNERIARLHSTVFARALNFHFDAFIRIYFIFFFRLPRYFTSRVDVVSFFKPWLI